MTAHEGFRTAIEAGLREAAWALPGWPTDAEYRGDSAAITAKLAGRFTATQVLEAIRKWADFADSRSDDPGRPRTLPGPRVLERLLDVNEGAEEVTVAPSEPPVKAGRIHPLYRAAHTAWSHWCRQTADRDRFLLDPGAREAWQSRRSEWAKWLPVDSAEVVERLEAGEDLRAHIKGMRQGLDYASVLRGLSEGGDS